MTGILNEADRAAIARLTAASPEWFGMTTAGEAAGCEGSTLLHAGPAFASPEDITAPIMNSARVAAVFQGLAADFEDARERILKGEIPLAPAQDHGVATPLASVVSADMPLHAVRDASRPDVRAWAPINGGNGPAMRLGQCNDAVLAHLRWLNGPFAEQLAGTVGSPLDLVDIARQSLELGDDCHGRTIEATRLLTEWMTSGKGGDGMDQKAREFLQQGPSFFLNLWMAAVKCMFRCAEGVAGSSLVTAAGANGLETGIQVSGLAGRWFTAPATPPEGKLDVDVPASRKLGAIGDSAVVDALGLGAMAMNFAPAQQAGLGAYMPQNGLALPDLLLGAVHPGFGELELLVGLCARGVVESGQCPVVSLGILDIQGELGRLGGGIFRQPMTLFEQAVDALPA